jgi:hypothetical protein
VPAALQCPDCGHQEMLDNLGGVSTFRCGGCGRALKVPAQFRQSADGRGSDRSSGPEAQPPAERTQALPKVPRVAPVDPGVPVASPPVAPSANGPVVPARAAAGGATPTPDSLHPPLILRFALWVIALPLGSLIVFKIASMIGVLTKTQLENTFLESGWGRFVPIARLLPFCALATALIVQLGVFGLERLRAHNLRSGPPGKRGPGSGGRGPRRPMGPPGQAQRATNGARSRARVIS